MKGHANRASAAQVDGRIDAIVGDLPIREVLAECCESLDQHKCLVLQAPPGAGKTTTLPLALVLHKPEYLVGDKKVIVLEPRIVAAKSAARRMASLLGEPVGQTVGYRVRLDSSVSARTRIEVVTEGVLLRRLHSDPDLTGVGVVLFDEFHERNLDADCALSLCLDLQATLRPDLRLAVMSATLGGGLAQQVANLMSFGAEEGQTKEVPIVSSQGRSYPVKTMYLGAPSRSERWACERDAAQAAQKACSAAMKASLDGASAKGCDVLVFLPGLAEIRQTARFLAHEYLPTGSVEVVELHANLAPSDQDAVVKRKSSSRQRIILSTPIAESSVTIEGVVAVVDTGLRKAPRYDTATGINRLSTTMISASSADQRRGRAGRTGPGLCYRLWDESTVLEEATTPEIMEADLAPLGLQLAQWGVDLRSAAAESSMGGGGCGQVGGLRWLDPPPAPRLSSAAELLEGLGAINEQGRITREGVMMSRMPLHPRFAHMVLQGKALGATELASVLASMLSERDLLRGMNNSTNSGGNSASLLLRLGCLAHAVGGDATDISGGSNLVSALGEPATSVAAAVDRGVMRRVLLGSRQLASVVASGRDDDDARFDQGRDGHQVGVGQQRQRGAEEPSAGGAEESLGEGELDLEGLVDEGLGSGEFEEGAVLYEERRENGRENSRWGIVSTDVERASSNTECSSSNSSSSIGGGMNEAYKSVGSRRSSTDSGTGRANSGSSSSSSSSCGTYSNTEGANMDLDSASTCSSSSSSSSTDSRGKDHDAAWRLQAGRDGLIGALVAFAYPDRLAIRAQREGADAKSVSFAMSGGVNVRLLSNTDPLGQTAEFLAIAELQGARQGNSNDIVRLAAPLSASAVDKYLKSLIRESTVAFWASASKSVLGRQRKSLGSLVLQERAVPVSDEQALPALFQGFREMGGIRGVGLPTDVQAWQQRVIWLRNQDLKSASKTSDLPDLSDQKLNLTAHQWLKPHLVGCRSKADCIRLPWDYILKSMLSRDQLQRVDAEVPSFITLPTGTKARIDFSREPPIIRAKIQEVFGLLQTPTLAGGQVPIAFELLSPAQRPLQLTSDLAGFWKTSYQAVRREQKGRYPRQYWPEDPSVAEPTKLSKKGIMEKQAEQKAAAGGSRSTGGGLSSGGGKKGGKGKK